MTAALALVRVGGLTSRETRALLERRIEQLIGLLDLLDGDADLEGQCDDDGAEDDLEPEHDAEPSLGATEGPTGSTGWAYMPDVLDGEEPHQRAA